MWSNGSRACSDAYNATTVDVRRTVWISGLSFREIFHFRIDLLVLGNLQGARCEADDEEDDNEFVGDHCVWRESVCIGKLERTFFDNNFFFFWF